MNIFSLAYKEFLSRKLSSYKLEEGYKRIYHYHNRKTGGTSINQMFLNLPGGEGKEIYDQLSIEPDHRVIRGKYVFVGWNKLLINGGHYFYAFSHAPMHKLRLPKNTFTFTIIRNPVERVISYYKMLWYFEKNNIDHPARKKECKYLGDSFRDFINLLPDEHLMNQLYMFSENFNIDEAFKNIKKCSLYFLLKDFNKGIDKLNEKLCLGLEPKHIRKSKTKIKIDNKDKRLLEKKLYPEIKLYEKLNFEKR